MTLGCSDNYIHGHGKSGVACWVTHVTSHVCIPMGTATTNSLSLFPLQQSTKTGVNKILLTRVDKSLVIKALFLL